MKVQLIVVQASREGKVIPLAGANFKIGRGEGCHLRPNSELVSREHAEFRIEGQGVRPRPGSRNGTLVNNKRADRPLRGPGNGDLVQVGPLTFAVSILGAPQPVAKPVPAALPARRRQRRRDRPWAHRRPEQPRPRAAGLSTAATR
ncbi:MAG: FHA domain-containing protein [Isosphaeraceae bacterium]